MEQLPQPDLLQDFEMDSLQRSATIGQRFINYLLDLVLFYVILTFVGVFLAFGKVMRSDGVGNSDFSSDNYQMQFFFITLIVFILFYTIIEGAGKGKSLGKLLTRTRAVKVDGSEFTWKDAFIRSICRLIPFEPFSVLGGTPWHDSISKTRVVQERK